MSGGEPSSIKRDVPCDARVPVPQLHAEDHFLFRKGEAHVPGALPQMAAQDLCRCHRPGAHHRNAAKAGGGAVEVTVTGAHIVKDIKMQSDVVGKCSRPVV